eukprot:50728-Karenia_brevis.AAC.1
MNDKARERVKALEESVTTIKGVYTTDERSEKRFDGQLLYGGMRDRRSIEATHGVELEDGYVHAILDIDGSKIQ